MLPASVAHRQRLARRLALVLAAAVLPVALAACGGGSPSAATTTTATSAATTTTTPPATATTAPPTTTTASTTTTTAPPVLSVVPMQTANGGEFYSPSHNISCEVDYQRAGIPTGANCQTVTPPRSVKMSSTGTLQPCTGVQCLGNPGIYTPTLPYGTATGVGPFRCASQVTGVTCTVNGTKGFRISKSGITPVTTSG